MDTLDSIIGHIFKEPHLLTEALTHGSVSYESQRRGADNQRLEFLGDAVLQVALSHALFERLPRADEGHLTKARAHLVSTKALAKLARQIELGPHLLMGKGEEANGGRDRDSSLADALEAVVGALYLDAGLETAMRFILRVMHNDLVEISGGAFESNPKGDLQEKLQAIHTESPSYQIVAQDGPDHAKFFESAAMWRGVELGRGSGRSKKEAEVQAAQAALTNPQLQNLIRSVS